MPLGLRKMNKLWGHSYVHLKKTSKPSQVLLRESSPLIVSWTRSCLLSNQQLQILGFTDGSAPTNCLPPGMSRCLKQTASSPQNPEKFSVTTPVADDVSNKRQNISREITVATVFPANLIKQGIHSENAEISLGPAQKTSLVQILSYSYFCLKIPHFSISPISFLLNWVVVSGEQPRRFYSDISAEGLEMSNSALCIDPLYCSSLLSTIRHF